MTVPVQSPRRAEVLYAIALFAAATAALALAWPGSHLREGDLALGFLFLLFSLFTISIGYQHPVFGYVSFDRVAQVSSVLVLGPVDGAVISGLASLIYPWHRLRRGVPFRSVALAALTNSGLMALMVLAGGLLYVSVGGPVPLADLRPATFAAVLLMLVAMQVINEAGIIGLVRMRGQPARGALSLFDTATELTAGLIAVLVAIVWNRMEIEVVLLLLAVLAAGMLALKRFAEMRLRLERIVEERTMALEEKSRELARLAAQDTLTGLFNRRHADDFLAREIERARRACHPISVALADIDHFKQINDDRSHATGDRVLERLAAIFRNSLDATDLAARYGGEEFLFCFTAIDDSEALVRCERLRRAVAEEHWDALSPGLRVTMSIGLATAPPDAVAATLLDDADRRLYAAKRLGRNRVVDGRSETSSA